MTGRKPLKATLALLCTLTLAAAPLSAVADPPPWAPAHGWRAKHKTYGDDLFFLAPLSASFGHCNRDLIGAVLGGVAGGAVGQTIGSGSGRTIATITGAVLGAVLGGTIGRSLDEADRACYGETLEYAPDRSTVAWVNPNTGASYQVSPQATWQGSGGQYCREYVTTADVGGQAQTVYGTACRQPDGSWRLMD